MNKRKLMALAGLVLTCQLTLTACQTAKETNTSTGKTSSSTKPKKSSTSSSKPSQSKQKSIPGVTTPTDDGFLLTDDKQITSKTKDGIVVEHDGHSHFIFYADLQGTKWAYLIPSGTNLTASSPARTATASSSGQAASEDHYVFNPADVVAEDSQGYTVRHGDHYHYILKSSLSPAVVAVTRPATSPLLTPVAPVTTQAGRGVAGIDYATSDGFLFDGTGVIGRTSLGLLVNHAGHTHLLTYQDLQGSKWQSLIGSASSSQARPASQPSTTQASSQTSALISSPTSSQTTQAQLDLSAKRAYLATSLGLSVDKIVQLDTPNGPAFLYPHDDHNHVIFARDIDLTKPLDLDHEPVETTSQTTSSSSSSASTSQTSSQTEPTTSQVDQSLSAKRAYLAASLGISVDKVVQLDTPNGPAFLYPHGDHDHVLFASQIDVTKPIDHGHEEDHGDHDKTETGEQPTVTSQTEGSQETTTKAETEAQLSTESSQTTETSQTSTVQSLTADQAAKRSHLAKALNLSEETIILTTTPEGEAFLYPHENHHHTILLADIDLTKIIETPEELEAKKAYISDIYGVPIEAIKVNDNFFVFNEPSHEYDPTHIHPFLLPRRSLVIPAVTGDAELDFETELLAVSKRTGLPIEAIGIKDNKFVIPHGNHDHYLKIRAVDGIAPYLAHKLPEIQGAYVAGDLDKAAVSAKVTELENLAKSLYGNDTKKLNRISRALDKFKADFASLASNSTAGYLAMLDQFDRTYITASETDQAGNNELSQAYNQALDLLRKADVTGLSLTKDQITAQINQASSQQDLNGLKEWQHILTELGKIQDRYSTAMQYVDYLLVNLDNSHLSADLREEVARLIKETYDAVDGKHGLIKTALQPLTLDLIQAKLAVAKAKAGEETSPVVRGSHYQALLTKTNRGLTLRKEISNYLNEVRDIFFGDLEFPVALKEAAHKTEAVVLSPETEAKLNYLASQLGLGTDQISIEPEADGDVFVYPTGRIALADVTVGQPIPGLETSEADQAAAEALRAQVLKIKADLNPIVMDLARKVYNNPKFTSQEQLTYIGKIQAIQTFIVTGEAEPAQLIKAYEALLETRAEIEARLASQPAETSTEQPKEDVNTTTSTETTAAPTTTTVPTSTTPAETEAVVTTVSQAELNAIYSKMGSLSYDITTSLFRNRKLTKAESDGYKARANELVATINNLRGQVAANPSKGAEIVATFESLKALKAEVLALAKRPTTTTTTSTPSSTSATTAPETTTSTTSSSQTTPAPTSTSETTSTSSETTVLTETGTETTVTTSPTSQVQ